MLEAEAQGTPPGLAKNAADVARIARATVEQSEEMYKHLLDVERLKRDANLRLDAFASVPSLEGRLKAALQFDYCGYDVIAMYAQTALLDIEERLHRHNLLSDDYVRFTANFGNHRFPTLDTFFEMQKIVREVHALSESQYETMNVVARYEELCARLTAVANQPSILQVAIQNHAKDLVRLLTEWRDKELRSRDRSKGFSAIYGEKDAVKPSWWERLFERWKS